MRNKPFRLPEWSFYAVESKSTLAGNHLLFQYGKDVSGVHKPTAADVHAVISCFADNKIAGQHPEWVPVAGDGRRAHRQNKREYFYCDWLCPSIAGVQQQALRIIEETVATGVAGIHLDSIHFPHAAFCDCARCQKGRAGTGGDKEQWKCRVVGGFVQAASKTVGDMPFSLTLYPDPSHPERFGLKPEVLEDYVDFFVVPLYDLGYATKYWLEILLNAFRRRLSKPFVALLYTKDVPHKKLLESAELCRHYTPFTGFAYDVTGAQKVISELT